MSPERLQQIEELYNDALALAPGERQSFLDRACGADTDLRREIDSLLMSATVETCLDREAIDFAAESLAKHADDVLMGRMLGRYQLLSLVGRGGMGDVYCGVDTRLNRLVAVKVLPSYLSGNVEWAERVEQEARAIASLNHPHICTLYDIGKDAGMHYLVFEYLIGQRLSDRLPKGALPPAEAVRYAMQMAEALDATHQEGIVHCDLKPHNIILTRTGLKLLDFGIAELRHADEKALASNGRSPGTLKYMAPEQIQGRETDVRTDIFAFGLVTYEVVTGRPAFQGVNQTALANSILNDSPLVASQLVTRVPPALDFLLTRCLAKNPSERWQSIRDVLFLLKWISA